MSINQLGFMSAIILLILVCDCVSSAGDSSQQPQVTATQTHLKSTNPTFSKGLVKTAILAAAFCCVIILLLIADFGCCRKRNDDDRSGLPTISDNSSHTTQMRSTKDQHENITEPTDTAISGNPPRPYTRPPTPSMFPPKGTYNSNTVFTVIRMSKLKEQEQRCQDDAAKRATADSGDDDSTIKGKENREEKINHYGLSVDRTPQEGTDAQSGKSIVIEDVTANP